MVAVAVVLVITGLAMPATTALAQGSVGDPCPQVLGTSLERSGQDGISPAGQRGSGDLSGAGTSGPLPATGSSPVRLALVGMALLLVGAMLVMSTRRWRRAASPLIAMVLLLGVGLALPAAPAVAQTCPGANGEAAAPPGPTPDAPAPVVPDSPFPALFPVIGVGVMGVAVLATRRGGFRSPPGAGGS